MGRTGTVLRRHRSKEQSFTKQEGVQCGNFQHFIMSYNLMTLRTQGPMLVSMLEVRLYLVTEPSAPSLTFRMVLIIK